MQTKKYLYAAVGAPVAVTKTARGRLENLQSKLSERREDTWKEAQRLIDEWAGEGEKVIDRVTDTKTIDELASKVDFDQVQSQVSKLRDQLEEMLATWRTNFSPRTTETEEVTPAEKPEPKAAATKPAAKPAQAKKPAAKKPAAKAPAAKAPAAPKAKTPAEEPGTTAS